MSIATGSPIWGTTIGGAMNLGSTVLNFATKVGTMSSSALATGGMSAAGIVIGALYWNSSLIRSGETQTRTQKSAALKKYALDAENSTTTEILLQHLLGLTFECLQIFLQQVLSEHVSPNLIQNYLTNLKDVGSSIGTLAKRLGGHDLQNNIFTNLLTHYIKWSATTNTAAIQLLKQLTQITMAKLSYGYKEYVAFVLNEDNFEKAGLMQYLDKDKVKNLYSALPANDTALLFYRYYSAMNNITTTATATATATTTTTKLYINHENLLTFAKDIYMVLPETNIGALEAIFMEAYGNQGFVAKVSEHNANLTKMLETIKTTSATLADQEAVLNKLTGRPNREFLNALIRYKQTLDVINGAKASFVDYVQNNIKVNEITSKISLSSFGINANVIYDTRPYRGSIQEIIKNLNKTIRETQETKMAAYNISLAQFLTYLDFADKSLSLSVFSTVNNYVGSKSSILETSQIKDDASKELFGQICKKYILQRILFCELKDTQTTIDLAIKEIKNAIGYKLDDLQLRKALTRLFEQTQQNITQRNNSDARATLQTAMELNATAAGRNVNLRGAMQCQNFYSCAIYDILFS
jgi:hypothetical protein